MKTSTVIPHALYKKHRAFFNGLSPKVDVALVSGTQAVSIHHRSNQTATIRAHVDLLVESVGIDVVTGALPGQRIPQSVFDVANGRPDRSCAGC